MSWSARQYSLFERQRTRPVHDVLAAVPRDGIELAVDLGCGPGNSTAVLQAHVPGARVIAIDSSIKQGESGELLFIENGVTSRGMLDGTRQPLAEGKVESDED